MCFSEILSLFFDGFDPGIHVSTFAVDHDDTEVTFLVGIGVFIGYDVGMPESLEKLQLVFDVVFFFLFDLHHSEFFDNEVAFFLLFPAEEYLSKRSISEDLYPLPISLPISYYIIMKRFVFNFH